MPLQQLAYKNTALQEEQNLRIKNDENPSEHWNYF